VKLFKIFTVTSKKEEQFLRRKTLPFEFSAFTRKELKELVQTMRLTMKKANGVGLSANQIGFNFNMFVAEYNNKFYAIFNPEILQYSDELEKAEEGCLSIPGKYGPIARSLRVTLVGQNVEKKKIKIRGRGFLAKIFQHEVDHLNGNLFTDKAESVYKTPSSDRLKEKQVGSSES
jgi:peptide deformylase